MYGRRLVCHLQRVLPAAVTDPDTVRLLAKSVIAGTVAWTLAAGVFHTNYATFAAFAAMLLMHDTIAESVWTAVHYTAAVVVGIALVGAVVLSWGTHVVLFPLILAVTGMIGRWHRLGNQGFNVAVAAIFAYGVFAMPTSTKPPLDQLRDLVAMVILGAVVAVTTNLLIAPPLRYRSAAHAVGRHGESVAQLLAQMADGLQGGLPDPDAAREWRGRSEELPRIAAQARSTVDHASETSKLNPRRVVVRRRSTFDGHRLTVHAVERIAEQLRSVTAGLVRASSEDGGRGESRTVAREDYLRHYAAVLTGVREAVAVGGAIHDTDDVRRSEPLDEAADDCRSALRDLGDAADSHLLDLHQRWAVYGALYTDAQRLCEEVESWRSSVRDAAEPPR